MQKRSSSFDVAVIGGGAVGLAVGWRAARRGLRTVVLERGEPGRGTSWVAAGMLAPVAEARLVEQSLVEIGLVAAREYPGFVDELRVASGTDPGYLACGTLFVARDRDEAEALERELELRRGLGLAVERLRASAARALEPALAPTLRLALEVRWRPRDRPAEADRSACRGARPRRWRVARRGPGRGSRDRFERARRGRAACRRRASSRPSRW